MSEPRDPIPVRKPDAPTHYTKWQPVQAAMLEDHLGMQDFWQHLIEEAKQEATEQGYVLGESVGLRLLVPDDQMPMAYQDPETGEWMDVPRPHVMIVTLDLVSGPENG